MGDEYSFLQEKIKDEAGSPKTFKKKIVQMIILGFIFGIIACFSFFACKPWVEGFLGQDQEEVYIPEDEETLEDEEEPDETDEQAQAIEEEQLQIRYLKSLQNTAKTVKKSIVRVSTQDSLKKSAEMSTISGVVIADNGSELLVLSQITMDDELKNVKITFSDGKECSASVKKKDDNIGIVVFAVKKDNIDAETLRQLSIVTLGNSLRVKSGDPTIILGSTKAAESVVSYGFVISSEEKKAISDGYIDLLRTDAAGAAFDNGMLFDKNGEMIGLISETLDDNETLVTAYSISDIKNELEHLSNGKGVPYIGIWGVALPEELQEEGLESGIWVEEIDTDSPVMKAGVQRGDVITQIADTTIYNMKDYRNVLLKQPVKKEIILTGFRKGADDNYVEMEFKVIVGQK